MIRIALLAFSLCGISTAHAATLTPEPCPFEKGSIPEEFSTQCHRMVWQDEAVDFLSSVAVFTPPHWDKTLDPVFYLPGGPGDAPVDDEAQPESLLRLFPDRKVVMYNPRGVENTFPRPACTIPDEYWEEDPDFKRELKITTDCHDAVIRQGIPMHLYEPRRLAGDVKALAEALELSDAGIFGVSYGTETALHLIAERPDWLRFAIVDSVSLPGVVGMADQLKARDAFLGLVETLCFTNLQCPNAVRSDYDGLVDWAKQFDAKPLKFSVGPDKKRYSYDSGDMLDFFASLASYPDGAAYAVVFLQLLEIDRRSGKQIIVGEVEANIEFGIANFALLLETYSDGVSDADYAALNDPRTYPVDLSENREYLDLFRAWNRDGNRETPFVTEKTIPEPAGIPVLMLSGGVDLATPLAWATRLHRRFSDIKHYIFPSLGHATAFGKEGDVDDAETIQQMTCAPQAIAAFLSDDEPKFPCGQYRVSHD